MTRRCTSRSAIRRCLGALALVSAWQWGCSGNSARDSRIIASEATACLSEASFAENVAFADEASAGEILKQPDEWARQLSPFEMAARQRTIGETDLDDFLAFLGRAGAGWTPAEEVYWSRQVARVSEAMAGLSLPLTDVAMVKTTGEEEFNFAYSRNRAIMIPDGRVQVSGDERRDFSFLSHEVFHYLSGENPAARDALFGLLGFRRITDFEVPRDLDRRRLSNPGAHSYDHALAVEVDSVTHHVVPLIQSAVPLEDLVQLPRQGPSPLLDLIEVLLVAVDVESGRPVESGGTAVTFRLEETNWSTRMERNTAYAIHPEEVLADNFALLLEWRLNGGVPTETAGGFPVNDEPLLIEMQAILTSGC